MIDVIESVLVPTVKNDKAALSPVFRKFSGYHTSAKADTRINFEAYVSKPFGEKPAELKGVSLSVSKKVKDETVDSPSFLMGFTFGEARTLLEYLRFALTHCFSALYADDKQRTKEYQEKKEAANQTL